MTDETEPTSKVIEQMNKEPSVINVVETKSDIDSHVKTEVKKVENKKK
jgi:hypothetical protein